MGWELGCYPQIEKCSIIISPNNDKIHALFNMREADSWHLFSGIHGFPFIFHCFKISLVYNIKRGIVTECPYTYAFGSNNGKPLWLHSIRFFLQDYKYAKYIDKVLPWVTELRNISNQYIANGTYILLCIVHNPKKRITLLQIKQPQQNFFLLVVYLIGNLLK